MLSAVGFFVAFQVSKQLFRWEPEAKAPRRAKLWALAALIPFLVFGIWENVNGSRLNRVHSQYRAIDAIGRSDTDSAPQDH